MKTLKTLAISSLLIFTTSVFADKNKNYEYDSEYKYEKKEHDYRYYDDNNHNRYEKHEDNKYKKEKKYKELPQGLEKKVYRGGELPPGWKKKYEKGEVLSDEDYKRAREIKHDKRYPYVKGTKIYEIQNKIFRVLNATREIIEVFE